MSGVYVGAGVAVAGIAGSLFGAKSQAKATKAGIKEQRRQFDLTRADQMPWIQAGTTSLGQLTAGTAEGGEFNRNFGADDFEADPGYAFRVNEGQRALDAGASARGGVLSGANLRATARYGQEYASNEYSNAYNRFNNDRSLRFNRLAGIAGLGQIATNELGAARGAMANNVSELSLQRGNAQAGGYAGAANALQSGLSTLGNFYQQRQLQQTYQDTYPGTVLTKGGVNTPPIAPPSGNTSPVPK